MLTGDVELERSLPDVLEHIVTGVGTSGILGHGMEIKDRTAQRLVARNPATGPLWSPVKEVDVQLESSPQGATRMRYRITLTGALPVRIGLWALVGCCGAVSVGTLI